MHFFYNVLFAIGFLLAAPFYFLKMRRRGNWRAGFGQRFGAYAPEIINQLGTKPVIWLHAVSVGEAGVCMQLLRELEPRMPQYQFVVSTTTSTGMGELKQKLPDRIIKIYYPVDFPWAVKRAMNTFRPSAVVLIEAEFWPNFLRLAINRKVPLFLVNARVSERSFRGYRRFGVVFNNLFTAFKGVGCQNAADATRLRQLGFPDEEIHVTGNLKFDAAKPGGSGAQHIGELLTQLGIQQGAPILVAGSTHAGEEAILAAMVLRLRKTFPNLFFVLVPRHAERAKEVGAALDEVGMKFVYRKEITPQTSLECAPECLLVNTTGELKFFYEYATLVFVGKTLTAKGGQNPIEPGALGKAMVFGPNMQNFRSIAAAFLDRKGAVQVQNAAELEQCCARLLADNSQRDELGKNALAVVKENMGATARTVELLLSRVPEISSGPS